MWPPFSPRSRSIRILPRFDRSPPLRVTSSSLSVVRCCVSATSGCSWERYQCREPQLPGIHLSLLHEPHLRDAVVVGSVSSLKCGISHSSSVHKHHHSPVMWRIASHDRSTEVNSDLKRLLALALARSRLVEDAYSVFLTSKPTAAHRRLGRFCLCMFYIIFL